MDYMLFVIKSLFLKETLISFLSKENQITILGGNSKMCSYSDPTPWEWIIPIPKVFSGKHPENWSNVLLQAKLY